MKALKFVRTDISKRLPTKNTWINLQGLIRNVEDNRLLITICDIRISENDNSSSSLSGSDFNIPIEIEIK